MTRRLPAVITMTIVLALTGCGGSNKPASPTGSPVRPSPTGLPAAIQVECTNIEHAFNVWTTSAPHEIRGDGPGAELDVREAMDAGKTLLDAVSGYKDQPSLALASAVARYNLDVSVASAEVTLGNSGPVGADTLKSITEGRGAVEAKFAEFKASTCT